MDIATRFSNYQPEEAFLVELRGPDGVQLFNNDNTPMTISVLGADSDIGVKARNSATNRRLQQGARAKLTAEVLESDAAAYLAKLTAGWSLSATDGSQPPFSYDAALALYSNPKMAFIREQVDAAIADRANFFKA